MTDSQACKILFKLTGFYNKTLTPEQTSSWIDELSELDEMLAYKVLNEIKTHTNYAKFMPTQPEFLKFYKKYIPTEKKEQEFCYVCNNKGCDIGMEKVRMKIRGQVKDVEIAYALYCDYCEAGKQHNIKVGDSYTMPISKFYENGINELIEKNKLKRKVILEKINSKNNPSKNIVIARRLLSQIG